MKIDDITISEKYSSEIEKRVYYAETDAGGIVYYGNLCKYIEVGCAEWFRKFAISLSDLTKKYNIFFVIKEAHLSYVKPIHYDEKIVIHTKLKKIQHFSIQFEIEVKVDGEKRYCAQNKMVSVNISNKKPTKIPQEVLDIIFEAGN